jgi:hypothetical protein
MPLPRRSRRGLSFIFRDSDDIFHKVPKLKIFFRTSSLLILAEIDRIRSKMVQIGQFPHGKHEAPVVVFSPTAKALQAVRPCHAAKTEEERGCNNGRELLEVQIRIHRSSFNLFGSGGLSQVIFKIWFMKFLH